MTDLLRNPERIKLFIGIGYIYLALWIFNDLVSEPETFFAHMVNNVWLIVYLICLNYIFFEYAIPFLQFTWKRILLAPVFIGVLLILYTFGFYAWRRLGIELGIYFEINKFDSELNGVRALAGISIPSIFFFGILRHIYDYRKLKQTAQQLLIQKQEAELNFLKSQTNPHFLFNTLNNIYSLSRDKSDLAPESIMRLSKILRFTLYEANGQYISIEKEMQLLNDYIELEKLRYDDSLRINFNHDVEEMKQSIPPLLLMPLVENAFKHGVSETRDNPNLDIHLSIKMRQLVFIVKNSTGETKEGERVKENIGLSNLKRQLELLYTDYNLNTQPGQSQFTATLKINLASHV